jgi:hypothetical protein
MWFYRYPYIFSRTYFSQPIHYRLSQSPDPVRSAAEREDHVFDEFLVAANTIDADAEKFHFRLQFTPGIAQVTGLIVHPGASSLWVKIQNQCRTCKVVELKLLATTLDASDCGCSEIGRWITNLKFHSHVRLG